MSRLIDVFPAVATDPLSVQTFHPVPVAESEVRKLCQVEHSARGGHTKLIRKACWLTCSRWRTADAMPVSAGQHEAGSPTGILHEGLAVNHHLALRAPAWELLRPAVVIRRRPKRDDPLSPLGR